jgi:hypothetical protein
MAPPSLALVVMALHNVSLKHASSAAFESFIFTRVFVGCQIIGCFLCSFFFLLSSRSKCSCDVMLASRFMPSKTAAPRREPSLHLREQNRPHLLFFGAVVCQLVAF